MTPAAIIARLAATLQGLWVEAFYELERRRRGPGGQQVGSPRWAMVPVSVLTQIERDCRHALRECGLAVDPMADSQGGAR